MQYEIIMVNEYQKELQSLMIKELSGKVHHFYTQYLILLKLLEKNRPYHICQIHGHELLKHTQPKLLSLHIKKGRLYNIRVICYFMGSQYILLSIFNEKNDNRQSSYEKYIQGSYQRLERYLRGEENDRK